MSPPISAWEEEEGIPKCHVNRFQPIAPIRAASTSGWQFATISGWTMPDPSVLATFVPKNAPIRLRVAAMMTAVRGLSTLVETTVAMALAQS